MIERGRYEILICPVCLDQCFNDYTHGPNHFHGDAWGDVEPVTIDVAELDQLESRLGLARFRQRQLAHEEALDRGEQRWWWSLSRAERNLITDLRIAEAPEEQRGWMRQNHAMSESMHSNMRSLLERPLLLRLPVGGDS